MELAQDRVQWRALVLAVLNLRVLLQEQDCTWELVCPSAVSRPMSDLLYPSVCQFLALILKRLYCFVTDSNGAVCTEPWATCVGKEYGV
jgi:hypothetical protein